MTQLAAVFAMHICDLMGHQHLGEFGALGRGVLGIFCRRFLG
jgi:hypothetical protein